MSMKNSNDTIQNRTGDLPACRAVPQPTALPRTPCYCVSTDIFPHLYISKQSLSLLTEFRATGGVCLSVFHWNSLQPVTFLLSVLWETILNTMRFRESEIQFYRTDCHKRSDSEAVFCGVCFFDIVSKIIANARTDVRREMKVWNVWKCSVKFVDVTGILGWEADEYHQLCGCRKKRQNFISISQ